MARTLSFLLAAFFALPLAAQEGARDITGSLSYLARIALPPDSEISVTARGAFDTVLGETQFTTEGKQVPLPFSLTVPGGLSGQVDAFIRIGGTPRWIIRDVPFSAGETPVDLGELQLAPITPLTFAAEYDCHGLPVAFGILNDRAMLRVDGRDFEMREEVSASGARYVSVDDPGTEFWSKGDEAMLTVEGQDMGRCVKVAPEEPPVYRAQGNEPSWHVLIGADIVELTADYGALTHTEPRPDAQVSPGTYAFDMPRVDARLTLQETLCHDGATGMPYPHSATLLLGDRSLTGCGGDPASLLTGAEWRIENVAGQEVIDNAEITIAFDADGRVSGRAGCNGFSGMFELTGEGLRFGQMVATMMACPEPQMVQERRVFNALDAVRRFDIDASGALLLIGGAEDAPILIARRS